MITVEVLWFARDTDICTVEEDLYRINIEERLVEGRRLLRLLKIIQEEKEEMDSIDYRGKDRRNFRKAPKFSVLANGKWEDNWRQRILEEVQRARMSSALDPPIYKCLLVEN